MTAAKTGAVGILIWGVLGAYAHAAPVSSGSGQTSWPVWYANRFTGTSGFATNYYQPLTPANWWTGNSPVVASPTVAAVTPPPIATPEVISAPSVSPVASFSGPSSSAPGATSKPDAFINFGNGPYVEASNLTAGTPQSWTTSPAVTQLFGGVPNAQQQSSFTQQVLSSIQQTFQLSGLNLNLTTDPNAGAAHTMSVVSGATYVGNSNAIGITNVGANGFGFIDKLNYAQSPNDLAWAVAHNISHELMHALGVSFHPDSSGTYLDTATANWQMLTDPNTKFSPEAVQLMKQGLASNGIGTTLGAQLLSLAKHPVICSCQFCHAIKDMGIVGATELFAQPVPEPSTMAIWGITLSAGAILVRYRSRKAVS